MYCFTRLIVVSRKINTQGNPKILYVYYCILDVLLLLWDMPACFGCLCFVDTSTLEMAAFDQSSLLLL
jgi:hypothetical protein